MTLVLNNIVCHRNINKDTKGTDDYHLFGWVSNFFLVICAIPYVRLTHKIGHVLGAVFSAAKLLSPNTHRELFTVLDIALYASALNQVFGL